MADTDHGTDDGTDAGFVVIGGGLGGAKAVEALRAKGYDGPLTLIGREEELPYERPPLSKSYLAGESDFADAIVHKQHWYEDNDVNLRLGVDVTGLDARKHELTLDDDETVGYTKLLLATGSTPRLLGVPGAVAENVLTLRTRADSDRIRELFGPKNHLVIVGGGWIALEVAAAARTAGTAVTLVERGEEPLASTFGVGIGKVFRDLHREHEVDVRTGLEVAEVLSTEGRVTGVRLTDSSTVDATAVVLAVGAVPDLTLPLDAHLEVGDGVHVDASLRTSDPDIWAVGDIAAHDHPVLGLRVRVEHWAAALNQPAIAAASMLGESVVYTDLPYVFSDQYDLGLEYIGYAPPGSYDRVVVRGDLSTRKFVAFYLDDRSRIMAALAVNTWDVIDEIKPLITAKVVVSTTGLQNPSITYAELGTR